MLSLVVVTVSAPDLAAAEAAYTEFLNYSVVEKGTIPEDLAAVWNRPRMAGRSYILMQPESNEQVYLRFVENKVVDGFLPLRTFGWNCNEILVEDPDAMAERLENSPFQIIGAPRNLSTQTDIRAMQAVGPAGEVIYLTRIPENGGGFDLGSATSFVDRTFVVVLGGPDLEAMRKFYSETFDMPVTEPVDARVSVLSKAHSMDPESMHSLAIARLPSKFLIEIDQYPQGAISRPCRYQELPPGISLIGFQVESLQPLAEQLVASAKAVSCQPYLGSRVGVIEGAAGELIELIEQT